MISADYPGRMRSVLEELTGAPCLFFQSAYGNVNAARMADDYEPARSLGTRLSCGSGSFESTRADMRLATSRVLRIEGHVRFECLTSGNSRNRPVGIGVGFVCATVRTSRIISQTPRYPSYWLHVF